MVASDTERLTQTASLVITTVPGRTCTALAYPRGVGWDFEIYGYATKKFSGYGGPVEAMRAALDWIEENV